MRLEWSRRMGNVGNLTMTHNLITMASLLRPLAVVFNQWDRGLNQRVHLVLIFQPNPTIHLLTTAGDIKESAKISV